MLSNTIKIGFPGRVWDIPAPASGMGFSNVSGAETSQMWQGTNHVANTPVSYKTFSPSWRSWTSKLQPLVDIYNKRYGNKEFFILDPLNTEGNLLPPRWAYSWQLAYCTAGQGQPYVDEVSSLVPRAVFNDKGWFVAPSVKVMTSKGLPLYLKAWGSYTGTARVIVRKHTGGGVWSAWQNILPTLTDDAPTVVLTASESQTVDFVEVSLQVNVGATLTLEHMDLSTTDYRSHEDKRRPGQGVGALRFTNTLDGELVSARIQRIGLSVEMSEVEYIRV